MRQAARLDPVVMAGDGLAALIAFALAYWFRFHVFPTYVPGGEPPDPAHYVAAAPIAALLVVVVFVFMGVSQVRRGLQFVDELFSVLRAMLVVTVVTFALDGIYREGGFTYSRLTLIYWLVAGSALIVLFRYLRRLNQVRRGTGIDRALVVGSGAAADLVIQRIRMFPDYGYQVVGVVADGLKAGEAFSGVDVVGRTRDLARVVRDCEVKVVFMAAPDLSQDRMLQLMESCRDCPADFRIVPSLLELMTTRVAGDQLDGIPMLQFRSGLDMDVSKATSKRLLDVVVAALGLVVLSPVLLLIAILVKVSSAGPVLLHQERLGMDEKPLRMHKFRTMRADAETESGPVWASEDDPRRTVIGKLLRRFSLDELPQLWNVLRGEMSLVGPRPERPVFVDEFKQRHLRYGDRHRVRPGLTGWAQVNDLRGNTPVEERLIYDLYYIENWSLLFDLKIILITLFRVFTHKNAY